MSKLNSYITFCPRTILSNSLDAKKISEEIVLILHRITVYDLYSLAHDMALSDSWLKL